MLDQKFIKHKIELIREDLELLEDVKDETFDELAKDPFRWNGVQHILQKVIDRGIDINQHFIAELASPKLPAPQNYTETFLRLKDLGILPPDFTKEIAKSAGFRNILVHEYNTIDEQIVYRSVREAIEQYAKYCDFILKFLNSAES